MTVIDSIRARVLAAENGVSTELSESSVEKEEQEAAEVPLKTEASPLLSWTGGEDEEGSIVRRYRHPIDKAQDARVRVLKLRFKKLRFKKELYNLLFCY